MKYKNTIQLASNCFFIKGFKKHLLIDFQREEWFHVDFNLFKNGSLDLAALEKEEIDYLIENQILITVPTKLKKKFSPILTNFDVPSIIEFAIIDRNSESHYSIEKTLIWLDQLLLKFCQIRYFSMPSIGDIQHVLNLTSSSNLESLELLLPYHEQFIVFFDENLRLFPKINYLVFHSAPYDKNEIANGDTRRLFVRESILSSNNCGIVHPTYFSHTRKHVLKNMNFNSCLYKKLGIDINGKIKNCPSMEFAFGSVDDIESIKITDLETEFWYIKKDDIHVCRDCEFRYICTDCRVRVVDGIKSRPSTCLYNPYTNKWKGDKDYNEPEIFTTRA